MLEDLQEAQRLHQLQAEEEGYGPMEGDYFPEYVPADSQEGLQYPDPASLSPGNSLLLKKLVRIRQPSPKISYQP